MKFYSLLLSLLSIFISGTCTYSQNARLKGKIKDSETEDVIPFVNVTVKEVGKGVAADINGNFDLEVKPGKAEVVFSAVGYQKLTKTFDFKAGATITFNPELLKSTHNLDVMVVSASKYEQRQQELTTTVEVIKPSLIENKNAVSIDKAIEQTPGVSIIDNEPQIRGGSGFSSGLGSRVMILMDDIPVLRADIGRPVWTFLPVENIEQIEVLKGASSVLYGSAALNGAINIRTAFAKDKPETKFTYYAGIYSAPEDPKKKYWSGFNPFFMGLNMSHAQKKDNVDFIVGANVFWDEGYVGPEKRKPKMGANEPPINAKNFGRYDHRARINFGTRVRNKKKEGLMYGINGNVMYQEEAVSYFWHNADSGYYNSYPGSLINYKNIMFYLDPYITYYNKAGDRHSLKTRYFFSKSDADNNQDTYSHNMYADYQYQRLFKKMGFNLISGLTAQYTIAGSEIFVGTPDGLKQSRQTNMALYMQLEKKLFGRLNLSGGARFEYFDLRGVSQGKPVFRAGANLTLVEGSFLRASIGQGFRFPTIGERYIVTNVGGFGFYPNPDLRPETSWNAEVGFKQMFKINNFVGFADVAGFWQEYKDFVEFNAGNWGTGSVSYKNFGFKFLNTGRARVRGVEASLAGTGKIHKNLEMSVLIGYTYSLPQTLNPDYNYASYITAQGDTLPVNFNNSSTITNPKTTSGKDIPEYDSASTILKYRIQHVGKLDIQFTFFRVSIGGSVRYYSTMNNIDKFFYDNDNAATFSTGILNYRTNIDKPNTVLDLRIGYELKKHFKFSIIMNNVLNRTYSLRPMNPEPPRNTSFQIIYKL